MYPGFPPGPSAAQQRMCCASRVEESHEGRESEESAAITKACPSREEEPLKRKWEEPRFGSNRTSCVHNLGPDLRSALPPRHNHCSCQHQKILNSETLSTYNHLGCFYYLGTNGLCQKPKYLKTQLSLGQLNPRKDPKHGSKSRFVHKPRKLHTLFITVS